MARIEPTIAVCATTSSPFCSAKMTTNSSGRLPSVDCSIPVTAGPEALAELLGGERHDPGEAGERERRQREARHRRPARRSSATPASAVSSAIAASAARSSGVSARIGGRRATGARSVALEDPVDEPVLERLLGGEEAVALHVRAHLLGRSGRCARRRSRRSARAR